MALAAVAVSAATVTLALAQVSAAVIYLDPAGDSGGEADITQVSIDTDSSTGLVTFAVTVTGFEASETDGRARSIQVYLATDATWRTGFADLALIAERGPGGLVAYVGHPKPGDWPLEPLPPTISFRQSGNILTWTFSKKEFGDADGFNFLMYTQIAATAGSPANTIADHAPDGVGHAWRYHYIESQPEPTSAGTTTGPAPHVVKPVFGVPTLVPATPKAGKKLVFTLRVRRSDSGAPLTTGRAVCTPSVAGVALRHTDSFANGIVRLSLVVPKTAKGKLLRVRVAVTTGSQSATKVVAHTVT